MAILRALITEGPTGLSRFKARINGEASIPRLADFLGELGVLPDSDPLRHRRESVALNRAPFEKWSLDMVKAPVSERSASQQRFAPRGWFGCGFSDPRPSYFSGARQKSNQKSAPDSRVLLALLAFGGGRQKGNPLPSAAAPHPCGASDGLFPPNAAVLGAAERGEGKYEYKYRETLRVHDRCAENSTFEVRLGLARFSQLASERAGEYVRAVQPDLAEARGLADVLIRASGPSDPAGSLAWADGLPKVLREKTSIPSPVS